MGRFSKKWAARLMSSLGIARLMRQLHRHRIAVLMYHGVVRDDEKHVPPWMVTESQFRWQMTYLAQHHRVLPLSQLVESLLEGCPLPPHSVALTFDDGFRNNYTIAYPILKEFGFPATIFLVTGYLDTSQALWPDVLFQLIHRTKIEYLDLSDFGDGMHRLKAPRDRWIVFSEMIEYLKNLPVQEKNRRLREISRRLQVDLETIVRDEHDACALLRWSEIQAMASEGLISFGVHTDTHEILTRLPFDEARREIMVSKQKLEQRLGEPVRFFAYPNGRPGDFNEAIKRAVKEQGFVCAFASTGGLIDRPFDPFALERLGISRDMSRSYFKFKLSGGVAWFERWLREGVKVNGQGQPITARASQRCWGVNAEFAKRGTQGTGD